MSNRYFIVYCSPAGSTRHVAGVIEGALDSSRAEVHALDLGVKGDRDSVSGLIRDLGPNDCLFVGSPVYRDLATPPVMAFIDALPDGGNCCAAPFVTWGGAASGVALWQMGRALKKKGFVLAGAAKILALHSMMWQSDDPVGQGHPDADDDREVETLVQTIRTRMERGEVRTLPLAELDYQAEPHGSEMKKMIGQPMMIVPKSLDEETCTQCGECAEDCPADIVDLAPYPAIGEGCFDCFNCIRVCPENAITPAISLKDIEALIRGRVEKFNEKPFTRIYM